MREILEDVANRINLNRNNIRPFLIKAFDEVSKHYNLCRDYQARAKVFGDAFEVCFTIIIETLFPNLEFNFTPNVRLSKACMERGGEADFAVLSGFPRKVIAVIEAKGSADRIICNGKIQKLTRPGMLRTDTTKKAIANAYQISRAYPDALFFIVTSHIPTTGNAKCMCDLAEGDIVNKIVDVTNPSDLDEMIEKIIEFVGKKA